MQQKYASLMAKAKEKQENYEQYNLLVSCSRDKSIKVWSVEQETVIYVLLGHDNWVRGLSLH